MSYPIPQTDADSKMPEGDWVIFGS